MKTNERFANLRRAAGISQCRLAKLSGMSQSLLSQFERGTLDLKAHQVTTLETILRREVSRYVADANKLARQIGEPEQAATA